MRIIDMALSPNFNLETNKNRGDWSLYDVSKGDVFLDAVWNKPECIDHKSMNCVSSNRTIWRCLECGRACYDLDAHEAS